MFIGKIFIPYAFVVTLLIVVILILSLYLYKIIYTIYSNKIIKGKKPKVKLIELRYVYKWILISLSVILCIYVLFGKRLNNTFISYKPVQTSVETPYNFSVSKFPTMNVYNLLTYREGYITIEEASLENQLVHNKIVYYDSNQEVKWEINLETEYRNRYASIEQLSETEFMAIINSNLVKFNLDGQLLMNVNMTQRILNTSYDVAFIEYIKDMAVVSEEAIILVGQIALVNNRQDLMYGSFIMKISSNGNIIWYDYDDINLYLSSVIELDDGSIISMGSKIEEGQMVTIMTRYDSNGEIIWSRTNHDFQYVTDLQAKENDVFVVGVKNSTINIKNKNLKYDASYAVISQIDGETGKTQWHQKFGGDTNFYQYQSLLITENDNIIVLGNYSDKSFINQGLIDLHHKHHHELTSTLIVTYDLNGNKIIETKKDHSVGYALIEKNDHYEVIGSYKDIFASHNYVYKFNLDNIIPMKIDVFEEDINYDNNQLYAHNKSYFYYETWIKTIIILISISVLVVYRVMISPDDENELYEPSEKEFFRYPNL